MHASRGAVAPSALAENLLVLRRPLLGREDEQAALGALLSHEAVGLVTLIGPGGVGKTRLALELANRLHPAFADGARFVSLASCEEPAFVAPTIAAGLGLPDAGGRAPLAAAQSYCAARRLLLVLDNWEHLLPAAPIVADLLAAAPALTILATSRTPLHLSGEHEYPVAPLAQEAAVALFAARVRDFRPDFAPDEVDTRAIAAVCARLDGLPLALELAAPRLKLFPPRELLARLERGLAFLTGGARDLPDRQRTLRATLDWSYALLRPGEQRLLARLAVFAEGGTWQAAEAVCADDAAPDAFLDDITGLLDHGLLRRTDVDGVPRFRLLTLVREYALEQLGVGDRADALRARHAAYYLALAEEAEPHLRGQDQADWQRRLASEEANLRAALRWAVEQSETATGLRLAGALGQFWVTGGTFGEGRGWLATLLERADAGGDTPPIAPDIEAKAALVHSHLAWRTGDDAVAEASAARALRRYRLLGDRGGIGRTLRILANIRMMRREYGVAGQLLEEAVGLLRAADARFDLAWVLNSLGELARIAGGDYSRAEGYYREALAIGRGAGIREGLATWQSNLGMVLLHQGQLDEAVRLLREGLELRVALHHRRGIAVTLEEAAAVAAATGRGGDAACLYGAAERLREELGAPRAADPADDAEHRRHIAAAQGRIDRAAWVAAWAAGRALAPDQALATARAILAAPPIPDIPPVVTSPAVATGPLSRRESQVAAMVARGLSNRAIAGALSISEKTVANHVDHILTKLDFRSRTQVAAWAVRSGLTDDDQV
jgi:predicted ATPase/DNA-binding CsgD family transcriptional regulator